MKKSFLRRCAAAVLAAAASLLSASALPAPMRASAASGVIYASPNGSGDGSSVSSPTTVAKAITSVSAGGYIYLLEGTYKFSSPIKIDNSNNGSSGKYKTIAAYNGAAVTFDFSGESTGSSNYGIILDGSYWHFYGFTVTRAGDNGMLLAGNNNIIENMVFSENQDTGLQISRYRSAAASISDWPTNNLVKNCTSKNNCDDATMENADGFAAKLTCGEGNVFDGCISYNNSDDGWDLYAKEETGPIGVVTIKNCIAFRNGFTEDGRGYGNCDGNGFKLGGGGIGTRHKVENCLAFENLNCGFTDNNNPEFGDMKDCTAYNNNLSGGDKANFKIYRNSPTATFANMLSYTSTANVSKTNAPGIKAANDKIVGTLTNGLYYNAKYYYTKTAVTMENGSKLGDVVTPADSDFITLNVGAMGSTDFHKVWRNADGSPNPGGFAETPSNGTYATLGYHMSKGVSQVATPAIGTGATIPVSTETTASTTASEQTTTETTATTANVPVSGDYVHNFTLNEKNSTFYTIVGNMNSKSDTITWNGLTLSKSLKLESATAVTFSAPADGTLTLVLGTAAGTIKVDGTKYTAADNVVTVPVSAGSHTIAKADSGNLFYIAYQPGAAATTETTTAVTTETTTETTASVPTDTDVVYGDTDGNGKVELLDVILLNKNLLGMEKLEDKSMANADVNLDKKVDGTDSLLILKSLVSLVTLPYTG
ncbi:MAG: hypothetical protein IJ236_07475 [Oscillospiraceae bacterium]|nr:hypothetical protein [Oscillospiraceae bacterium]